MKAKIVTFNMKEEEYNGLKGIAKELNKTIGEVVRGTMLRGLKRYIIEVKASNKLLPHLTFNEIESIFDKSIPSKQEMDKVTQEKKEALRQESEEYNKI